MKNALNNIALKILAIVLSFVLFFAMLISFFAVGVMLFNDFYTSDFKSCEFSIMSNLAHEELYKIETMNQDYIEDYYSDKNVVYEVENLMTGKSISNFKGQDYIGYASKTVYESIYVNIDGEIRGENGVHYEASNTGDDEYLIFDDETREILTEIDDKQEIRFTVYIPQKLQYTDRFWLADKLITFGYNNRYVLIFIAIISLCLCIVIYSYLFMAVGHKAGAETIKPTPINRVPADILTAAVLLLGGCGVGLFAELSGLVTGIVFGSVILTFLYFLCLWYLLSIVAQAKAKTLVKHTFLYWCFKKLSKLARVFAHIFKNVNTVYKAAIVIGAIWVLQFILIGFNAYEADNLIISWLVISAVVSVLLLLGAIAFQKVKAGGEKIVNGDLENKIDTAYMFGDIKDFAESLNNINNGLQSAIDDKMRSERFKTELITNVSHDIKTPLTSIVNYVDLIKKEECENPKIAEYIEVLDRQSKRLKKLIEDLVEASKAQTGNISVELERCNIAVLIIQAVGEFSERLEAKNLQVVQSVKNDEAYVMADGRRLWRVFDNLLTNICKYAMSGTRVYVDLNCENGKAIITFKNISEMPINVSGEELIERFVRGDRSRNTEGSGLGLSIAKSLTELQNGSFEINTDGDLFKAKLTFDVVN